MKKILSVALIMFGFVMAQGFSELIDQADAKYDVDDFSGTHELLQQAQVLEPDNFEVIWRLARVHFDFSDNSADEAVISENLYSGLEYAKKALELDESRVESHKWYGILIGRVGEMEGTKQKIINSYEVRDHTVRAIELDPTDDGLYNVMGQWHYAIAELSWVMRKFAATFFATPPEGSFEESRDYFAKATELAPDGVRNFVWLGKANEKLDDTEAAKNAYNDALAITAGNDSERLLQEEAQQLLSDL